MDQNMIIKKVYMIALGGITGGILGYLIARVILNQLEKMDEEFGYLDDPDLYVYDRHEEKEDLSEMADEVENALQPALEEPKNKVNYTHFVNDKGELDTLAKPYKSSIDALEKQNELFKNFSDVEILDKKNDFRILTLEEYTEDSYKVFAKETILYYEGDTTFTNEGEDLIDGPESLFGPNIHLHFGEGSEDPDVVYLRNNKTGTDYEIRKSVV